MTIFRKLLIIVILSSELFYSAPNLKNSNSNTEKGKAFLSGRIVDEKGIALPYVSVTLPALHRGVLSNENGEYLFDNLYSGRYTVEFVLIGYKKETRNVNVSGENIELNVTLYQSFLLLPGIIVTGKPQPTDILSSSQSISTIEGRELERTRGENIINAIQNSPGVSAFTTGNGIAKPVIRGLTSQRVLVISDGVRQEGQQWGDEHGIEIDAFDVERIEVLRGPGSVLYGSDALGGVVNIIKHDLPSTNEYPVLGGEVKLNAFSNNEHAAGDLSLFGASGSIGYRGHFSLREAGDINTPKGKLFNSGISEVNGGGLVGLRDNWGMISIDYSRFDQELEIHENPAKAPGATPYQKINHDKIHFHNDISLESFHFEMDGSWQRNIRKEFEKKHSPYPVLQLNLNTLAFDLKAHHEPVGNIYGTIGLSVMSQKNESTSEEQIIPGFNQVNYAGFLYEEYQVGKFNISVGIRYDLRKLKIKRNDELSIIAQLKNYNAISGTAGLVYRVSEPLSLALNIGRGWRSPTPFELFVNGIHEGTTRYEIGDPHLKNESSLNTDFAFRYVSNKVQFELTLFRNIITDYIFLNHTGGIDTVSGYPKYINRQADAKLSGSETSLKLLLTDWLQLNGGYNYIYAVNKNTNNPLPLIPANSIRIGAVVTTKHFAGIVNPYIAGHAKIMETQNRVEQFESRTGGYALLDVAIGGEIIISSGRLSFDLNVENLFDRAYVDHLSRYKEYALSPGRNIKFQLSVPFMIIK